MFLELVWDTPLSILASVEGVDGTQEKGEREKRLYSRERRKVGEPSQAAEPLTLGLLSKQPEKEDGNVFQILSPSFSFLQLPVSTLVTLWAPPQPCPSPWRTLGQQRSLLCNLQASEDQAERRRLQGAGAVCRPQLPGSLYLQGPPACLTSRLSLGLSVFEGPPPGPPCHSEGPPGPASGSELCGGCTGKGTPPSKTC